MNTASLGDSAVRRPISDNLKQVVKLSFPFLLFAIAFFPRAINFVGTSDLWHQRGKEFINGLLSQNWEATLQAPHPGVITMWLSGLTQLLGETLISGYDDFSLNQKLALEVIPFALVVALTIVLAYFLLANVFDRMVAAVATLLLALDPYHISLAKAIHVDALVSVFMMSSALFLWVFIKDPRWRYLIFSGAFAALGILTKTPALFMIPYFLLVVGVWQANKRLFINRRLTVPDRRELAGLVKESGKAILIWSISLVAIYVLLWPSMWSQPGHTLHTTLTGSNYYLENPHEGAQFFLGKSTMEDPGPLYYPVTMTVKTTAVVTIGFLLSLILFFSRRLERQKQITLFLGLAFIFFFAVMMTLGEKKFIRYALPALQFVILSAGIGYVYTFRRLTKGQAPWYFIALALIIFIQAAVSLPLHPYYGTHYNYLLGGPKFVLNNGIVEGQEKSEGMAEAAEYLNSMPMAPLLVVGSHKLTAFYRYFEGKAVEITDDKVDYLVFSRNIVLRNAESGEWQKVWEAYKSREPKYVVEFNGVPYVWVYKTGPVIDEADLAHPAEANLGENFRLLGYDYEPAQAFPGGNIHITLYWESLNPTAADYTVFIHLLDEEGQLQGQKDSQPLGGKYPTYLWDRGERIRDDYELTIDPEAPPGSYDLAIGMYELQNLQRLPILTDSGGPQPDNRLLLPGPTILAPES